MHRIIVANGTKDATGIDPAVDEHNGIHVKKSMSKANFALCSSGNHRDSPWLCGRRSSPFGSSVCGDIQVLWQISIVLKVCWERIPSCLVRPS